MRHVAVLKPKYLRAFLDGEKIIEARLLRRRVPPFGVVRAGDRVYVKGVGQPVKHACYAGWVLQKEDMGPGTVDHLHRQYDQAVGAPIAFWASRLDARHAVLMRLVQFRAVSADDPIHAAYAAQRSRNPRAGWLTIDDSAYEMAA